MAVEKRESLRVKAHEEKVAQRAEIESKYDTTTTNGQSSIELEDEPELVTTNKSVMIGSQGVKVAQLGVSGLRQELMRVQGLLVDGLKRSGSHYSREGRKVWENSVRNADTLSDLRSALQELEVVVRGVQTEEDEKDEDEANKGKAVEREEMVKEGWLFSADDNEHVGITIRRFFKGSGKSDGTVVSYLPADYNEGISLWRMEHTDGDVEDLDEGQVLKGAESYEEDRQDDDDASGDEVEEGDEEEEDEEEEDDEEEDDEEEIGEGESAKLWPTGGVRARWIDALQKSRTISEVALALSTFLEHARNFGVVDTAAEEALGQFSALDSRRRQSALWGRSSQKGSNQGHTPYKRKGSKKKAHHSSSSNNNNGRGELRYEGRSLPQRAAARKVTSYYEG